ncbi:MAG: hypothetical protein AB2A00_07410 [Myxococcota bacterium]
MGFEGFTEKDFETYRPQHRTSAMYTLARRQVRDKLKVLMTEVQARLGEEAVAFDTVFSSETPSLENNRSVAEQGVYLIRSKADQEGVRALVEKLSLRSTVALDVAVFHKHAALGLVVDDVGIKSLLSLHPRGQVDRQNLKARLSEGWAQDAYAKLLQGLPGDFTLVLPGAEAMDSSKVTVDVVLELQKALETDAPMTVFRQHPRTTATDALPEVLAADLRTLLPVYRFGAWARDHDFIQAQKAIKEHKQEARKATQYQVGDRVKILSGLWSGRQGTVEEVDKKGVLKVQVGLVSVKVDAKDAQAV